MCGAPREEVAEGDHAVLAQSSALPRPAHSTERVSSRSGSCVPTRRVPTRRPLASCTRSAAPVPPTPSHAAGGATASVPSSLRWSPCTRGPNGTACPSAAAAGRPWSTPPTPRSSLTSSAASIMARQQRPPPKPSPTSTCSWERVGEQQPGDGATSPRGRGRGSGATWRVTTPPVSSRRSATLLPAAGRW